MALQIVRLGPEFFPNPTIGRPIANGDIFVGIPDLDPEIEANRQNISLQQEDGTIVPISPASQPISTSAGGLPLFNGSPVTIMTDGNYSLKVLNSNGSQAYFIPSVAGFVEPTIDDIRKVSNMLALTALTGQADGDLAEMLGYFTVFPQAEFLGGGTFAWQSSLNKNTANGGTIIDPDTIGAFDGTSSTLAAFLAAQGSGIGSGCWVREGSHTDLNIQWFGGTPGSGSGIDHGSIVNIMIDVLDTGQLKITGGSIFLPRGSYDTLTPVVITSSGVEKLSSIRLFGEGMQNSALVAQSGFPGGSAVVESETGTFCEVSDLHLDANSIADHALWLKGQLSGFSGYSHIKLKRLRLQFGVLDGFVSERGFLIVGEDVFSTNNGGNGFNFKGYHTSSNIKQWYAVNNTASGFRIVDMSYSTFLNCATDGSGLYGYSISNTKSVNFINCGAESTQRNCFYFEASAALDATANRIIAGISDTTLDGCLSFNNDLSGAGFGSALRTDQKDTSSIDIIVRNFGELTSPNGISVTSAGTTLNHKVRGFDNSFAGSYNTETLESDPFSTLRVHALSVTALTTVADLKSIFGTVSQYSGILHILAANNEPSAGTSNTAAYVLLVTKSTTGSGATLIASNGFTSGAGASAPSFTFSLDTTNNLLQATPIGATSGTFYFYITQAGALTAGQP